MLEQCREIVDTANAMDASVGARWLHVGFMSVWSGGTDFVAHPPHLMPILSRGRHVLGCRGMQKLSRCCCCRGKRVFRVKQTNASPGCDFDASLRDVLQWCASLKCAPPNYFRFVRFQAEAWRTGGKSTSVPLFGGFDLGKVFRFDYRHSK